MLIHDRSSIEKHWTTFWFMIMFPLTISRSTSNLSQTTETILHYLHEATEVLGDCREYLCFSRCFRITNDYVFTEGKIMYGIAILMDDNGPLTRYAMLRVAHALVMPGTFSPPPWVSDPDMHPGTCVAHVPWCMPGSLTSGFLWSRWRGKRSRHSWHSRRMRNRQFGVSGKKPMHR